MVRKAIDKVMARFRFKDQRIASLEETLKLESANNSALRMANDIKAELVNRLMVENSRLKCDLEMLKGDNHRAHVAENRTAH